MYQSDMFNITMKFIWALGVFSLLTSVVNGGVSMHNPFFCYSTDPIRSMNHMMGLGGSYEAIRRINFTTVKPYISTCTPSRFWYLGRYAARQNMPQFRQRMIDFAESSVQSNIVNNYEAGRTTLCQSDYESIRDFEMSPDFADMENPSMVLESGVIAMQNIAIRFQQNFPNILTQNYSPDHFHFRHTGTEWTNASIRAFVNGLFGEAESQNVIYEEVPERDWFLRSLDNCPAHSENANGNAYRTAFREGPEIEEMIEQVNRKLGFHASNHLSFDQIFNMWNWCRFIITETFETSGIETGANSSWCAPFSVAHHSLFTYESDLNQFHQYGYGVRNQRLLENTKCGLMQDLLNHIQSNNSQMARIFVTEPREILSMFVLLGAFRDVFPIHQHNYAQQLNRRWNTSMIAPFSSNLAVILYEWDVGENDLIFLVNEKPILIPGCDQQTGVCKLGVFVNRFRRFIDVNCEQFFCSND